MKITKTEGSDERMILTGCIVDKAVCARLAAKSKVILFRSKWANLIARWCFKYFETYEKAPGPRIEHIFARWAEKTQDENTVTLVEDFLASLSDEWVRLKKESNSDYVLDVAEKYFTLVQMEHLKEDIEAAVDTKDADQAQKLVTDFTKVNIGATGWIDPLQDKGAIQKAFESASDPLIRYHGALGKFFGDRLERDGLVYFEGPEKRGKTFWLMDMVFRAAEQRRRVAYFQVGDMSQDQILRRMMVRAAGTPMQPCTVKFPIGITTVKDDDGFRKAKVKFEERVFDTGLDWVTASRAARALQYKQIKSKSTYIRLSVHPNDTLSVPDIRSTLTEWAREGWVVDVLVIDYADILRMDYYGLEGRDRINQTWKDLRKISQVFHCLVLSASQSDAAGGEAYTLGRKHFSEDKRKRSHVTGTIGLNQTEEEKRLGVMRLNWIVLREGAYLSSRCVHVAGCPEIGNLAIRSTF